MAVLGLAVGLLVGPGAEDARAQEPDTLQTPADTAAADTVGLPTDSLAADSLAADSLAADSLAADSAELTVRGLVVLGDPEPAGWADGVWEWDREALLAEGAFTLTDLLERIPGVSPVRHGFIGMPEAVTGLGATGGRVEIVLDGYVLDPLAGSTIDMAGIRLNQLSLVRVERRVQGLRVELETAAPSDPRPYSQIQAAKGELLNTQLLRGIFLTPSFLGGPLSLGIERLSSDGLLRREKAVAFGGWLKWGLLRDDSSGVQLEYRSHRLSRDDLAPLSGEDAREDWILRGRTMPLPNLTTEAYLGYSSLKRALSADAGAPQPGAGLDSAALANALPAAGSDTTSTLQSGLRAQYETDQWWTRGGLRLRTHDALPRASLEAAGGVRLPGLLHLRGELRGEHWTGGEQAASGSLATDWRPLPGLRGFAEVTSGARGVPFLRDTAGAPVFTDRAGARIGAAFTRGGFRLGAAGLRLERGPVPSFGLHFDRTPERFPGGTVHGWEATLRSPLLWEPLAVVGSITEWAAGNLSIYQPSRRWRAALEYHHLPLQSDDLELFATLEARHRGRMAVPAVEGGTSIVPSATTLDFSLQIRILSLRAFLRWDNITHQQGIMDLPGRTLPGQRLWYGVKWHFWN